MIEFLANVTLLLLTAIFSNGGGGGGGAEAHLGSWSVWEGRRFINDEHANQLLHLLYIFLNS